MSTTRKPEKHLPQVEGAGQMSSPRNHEGSTPEDGGHHDPEILIEQSQSGSDRGPDEWDIRNQGETEQDDVFADEVSDTHSGTIRALVRKVFFSGLL